MGWIAAHDCAPLRLRHFIFADVEIPHSDLMPRLFFITMTGFILRRSHQKRAAGDENHFNFRDGAERRRFRDGFAPYVAGAVASNLPGVTCRRFRDGFAPYVAGAVASNLPGVTCRRFRDGFAPYVAGASASNIL